MSRNLPALLGGTSIKDINCPLKSKKEEDRDGYVSVTHFGEHAATGCDKCCLLREIAIKFKVRITYFNTESDWTNVRFKTGPNVEYLSVDIFTPQGQPKLFRELKHRPAIGNTSTEESLARAKTWISRCSREHESCQRPPEEPLPKRIIEIEEDKLRLLTETGGQFGSYIALSHCWGDSRSPCLTTTATIEVNTRGIAWTSLPNTLRDAILACRELRIRYLWIDSICIIQDDDIDWKEESGKMAEIYYNSYLTICATSAQSDDGGLWPSALKSLPQEVVVQRQSQDFEVYFRLEHEVDAVHLGGHYNNSV